MPIHYLIFAAEVLFTTLGLLFVLIYFYIKTDREWQLHIHSIQDQLLNFRNRYLEEKERADVIRELLYEKNSALEKAMQAVAKVEKNEKGYLAEITRLKEEVEQLLQSEKLRSEIVNQLVTSKIEIEQLTAKLNEKQTYSDELQVTINTLEDEVSTFNSALQPAPPTSAADEPEQGHDLQTSDELELERLRIRTDKQNETIRELELELMKLGYKNPSKLTTDSATATPSSGQDFERMLSESETCIQLLESELSGLQEKTNNLEEQARNNQATPQNSGDMQQLEQMLKESETCNTLLETELNSLMEKVRLLEEKEKPLKETAYYDI